MLGDLADGVAAGRPRDVARNLRASGGGKAAIHGAALDRDGAAHLDGAGRRSGASCLLDIVQGNPASSALELAPLGGAGAAGLGHDGVDTRLDEALAAIVGSGASADVEVGCRHLNSVVYGRLSAGASAGAGCAGGGASAGQALIDLRRDLIMQAVEVITRAALIGEPAVNGHHHLVGLGLIGQGLVLVAEPEDLGLPVPAADVRDQVQEGGIGRVGHLVGGVGIRRHLDGNGAIVVVCVGAAPGTVLLLDVHTDLAVLADAVVAAGLSGARSEHAAEALDGHLSYDTMNGHPGNSILPGAALIGADLRIADKAAVTHGPSAPLFRLR